MGTENRVPSALSNEAGRRRETFTDETSTGRYKARGHRKAIIAATVEGRDYDWWSAFCRDYFPGVDEVKAKDVLPLVDRDREARDRLFRGLADGNTAVVIIDFSEFTASLVRSLYDGAGIKLDADPLDILEQGRLGEDLTRAILRYSRRAALEESTVSRIEWLFWQALRGAPMLLPDEPGELINREAFDKLDAKAQGELVARFSVIFGEALDPRRQVELLVRRLEEMRYLSISSFSYMRLEYALETDRTFDRGSGRAFALLTSAYEKMVDVLKKAMYMQWQRRAGAVKEEDSRNVLGIQVADIAAALAAREYELAPGGPREKAARVRTMFDRVLLNDEWV